MKQILLIFCLLLVLQETFAQYTQVPDPNFEQALIDLGIDSEGTLDGQFLTADALGVITLDLDYKNISDVTGIEAFVDLEQLFMFENNLTEIDLSVLPEDLFSLSLSYNNLTSIDLSFVPNVVNLYLNGNNFISVDASNLTHLFIFEISNCPNLQNLDVTNCINLTSFYCYDNTTLQTLDLSTCGDLYSFLGFNSQFTSLDFSGNPNIYQLNLYNTPLTSIHLPNNPNLDFLKVSTAQLTDLDITNCPALDRLECANNMLTSLDTSQNPVLDVLQCQNNQITSLDLTQNNLITWVRADHNNIGPSLDLSNNNLLDEFTIEDNMLEDIDFSNNTNLTVVSIDENPNLTFANMQNGYNENLIIFFALDCPQLTCVVVDDPTAENGNFAIDPNATLVGSVEDCDDLAIAENILQQQITTYPNPVQNSLHIVPNNGLQIQQIQVYDVLGKLLMQTQNTQQINTSHLSSGILFIKIQTNKGVLVKKVVKE